MKTAQITSMSPRIMNNRLVKQVQISSQKSTNGQLIVELMQALQKTQKFSKENPREAELNRTTMSDNNGKRIIYNLNINKMS